MFIGYKIAESYDALAACTLLCLLVNGILKSLNCYQQSINLILCTYIVPSVLYNNLDKKRDRFLVAIFLF